MRGFYKTKTKAEKRDAKERDSHSMKKHQAFLNRRSMRRSELGKQTEDRVEKILVKKLGTGDLVFYERFAPNSPEDSQGKDFRVTREIDGEKITASFGITISLKCHQEHQASHADVPSILIPPEMSDERIWYRICQILK